MNLLKRFVIAFIFIPLIIYLTVKGGNYFLAFVVILSTADFIELKMMLSRKKIYNIDWIYFVWIPPLMIILSYMYGESVLLWGLIIYNFIVSMILIDKSIVKDASLVIGREMLIYVYTILLPASVLFLRNFFVLKNDLGGKVLIFIFLLTWIGDTAAYFGGVGIPWKKRHLLAPVVSPKKSWEGSISEVIVTILAAFLLNQYYFKFPFHIYIVLFMGVIVSTVGQVGDLIESLFKRDVKQKDSSNLIPGHGGMLDRFDSLIYNCAAIFLFFKLVL